MKRLLLKLLLVAAVIMVFLTAFKPTTMTFRQAILKTFYPVIMFFGKVFPSKHAVLENSQHQAPLHSFYTLKAIANDGSTFSFSGLQGKKVMIVNTASDCGFTAQYAELEKLYEAHKSNLVIIAFPANDFQQQEKGSNAEIASFCKKNYGVSFPLMQKSVVIEKAGQNDVFQWLTSASGNGWCTQPPVWNFCKYIINEQGILTHFFSNTVSPLDKKVLKALAE